MHARTCRNFLMQTEPRDLQPSAQLQLVSKTDIISRAKIRKDRITEKGKKETSEKEDDKRLAPTEDFIFLGEKKGEEYFSSRRFRRKTRNASRMFGVTSEQVGSEFKTF